MDVKQLENDRTRAELEKLDEAMKQSGLADVQQAAVLMNATVLAVARMRARAMTFGSTVSRGEVINASVKEFRQRLQKYLPFEG